MKPIKEQLDSVASHIAAGIEIETGFPQLDLLSRGFHRGEQVILAGRSSMGKTSLMTDMILHTGRKYNVGVFSFEMSENQLIERMIANKQGASYQELKMGKVPVDEDTIKEIASLNISIDDCAGKSVLDVMKTLESSPPLDVVFVDYLQLVRSPAGFGGKRHEEVDRITQYLREVGRKKKIAMVVLCQLNREVERRESHKPRLSDLRESGGIEQTADTVLLLYRPAYYKIYEERQESTRVKEDNHLEFKDDDGEGWIIVAKNRNGPIGEIPVVWDARSMSYKNPNFELEQF